MSRKKYPLVILGFDAGDPRLLEKWGQDGTLPNLHNLLARGCWGCTAGPEMVSEHGMWTTLMSGVSRAQHGYYYFRQLVPGTYRLAPARGRHLNIDPFWHDLGDHRKIAVIDVPDIAAPRAQPGIQLSEWATHYPYFPASASPPGLLQHVREVFGPQIVIDEKPMSGERDDRSIFDRLLVRVAKKAELCRRLLEEGDFDVICIVFGETHTGAHQLWKYGCDAQRPRITSPPADLAEGIRRLYQATDEAMGGILRQIGDGANVFVMSSVGMKRQYPAAGLGEALTRHLGYQAAPSSSLQRAVTPMAMLRRVLPRNVRNQLSRLLPQATQERWVSDKFELGTDWDRTSAFCIPSWYTSFFRVNLRGREPRGIVAPGAEYEGVLDRLEHDLRLLVDPVTGKPAIEYLARATQLFGGGPPQTLPDLFAEWAEADHFMDRVSHPRGDLHQEPCEFHRDSDHSRRAFVAAAGPLIGGRGNLGELSPLDLAPTFRHLLGADPVGRPHAGILGSS